MIRSTDQQMLSILGICHASYWLWEFWKWCLQLKTICIPYFNLSVVPSGNKVSASAHCHIRPSLVVSQHTFRRSSRNKWDWEMRVGSFSKSRQSYWVCCSKGLDHTMLILTLFFYNWFHVILSRYLCYRFLIRQRLFKHLTWSWSHFLM